MKKLFDKYRIEKTDGTPVDPKAQYFVLRLDTDPAARQAIATYALAIRTSNPLLSRQIADWLEWIASGMPETTSYKTRYTAILWDMHDHKPEFMWKVFSLERGLKLITDVLDASHIPWKIASNSRQVILPDAIFGDYVLGSVSTSEIIEDILSE